MKKTLLFAAAASMMMLQACTSEENFGQDNTILVPGNSEVKISLSSSSSSTGVSTDIRSRAAVESTDTLNNMGVFCLAREAQDINQSPSSIDWTNWSGCVMNNVLSDFEKGSVTWENEYYYPISQFYAYDFYGYYPYSKDSVTVSKNQVTVQYTLTGKEDLIWGRATSDEQYAYSARYFRTEENVGKTPSLNMKHMLTRLKFVVKTGSDLIGGASAEEAKKMIVKSIVVKSAKPNVNLTWSNSTATEDNARLELRNSSVADFPLCDVTGKPVTDFAVSQEVNGELPIGESIMLYPEKEYILEVVLANAEGEEFTSESPLTLSQDALFAAGKNYTVTITVHGPKPVQLKAALNSWEDAKEGNEVEL